MRELFQTKKSNPGLGHKNKNEPEGSFQIKYTSKPISRVLSCAEIYLGRSLPKCSSRLCNTPAEQTITYCSKMTLHRVGFTWQRSLLRSGELLPRLSILTKTNRFVWRYISVALSLRSPSAAVSSYPALWSPDFPHISLKNMRRCLVCSALRLNNIAHKAGNNNPASDKNSFQLITHSRAAACFIIYRA